MPTRTQFLKLNLGSRDTRIPGFKNVDCDPHDGVDFVSPVEDMAVFDDGCADEIYASHILEHFSHRMTNRVLKEWARLLKKGGILYVSVPDFDRAAKLALEVGLNEWVNQFLMGDQGYETAFHYSLFNEHRLKELLLGAGFSEASKVDELPIMSIRPDGAKDCSRLVSTYDNKPVSLNMVAVK